VQRIFNCDKLQDSSLTPDEALNILIYMQRFSVPSLNELQFFQMIGFFWLASYVLRMNIFIHQEKSGSNKKKQT